MGEMKNVQKTGEVSQINSGNKQIKREMFKNLGNQRKSVQEMIKSTWEIRKSRNPIL
ncbi:hypothetical protein J2S13_001366 [Oikeobacillus pervagus]|uniref:Uncharacterized protein n=1 Tax=Oikeobacillus pervagus TaxID=1325931 RepID=A0AAJ1WGE4_9BACI|nr:hypothetical protein [Oikeobacillus pervagus]